MIEASTALSPRRPLAKTAYIDSTVASTLVVLILAYTVFAMLQELISFSMNRVIGAVIILVLSYDFLRHLTRPKIVASCLVGVSAVLSLGVFSTNCSLDFDFYIYWCCTLLFLAYMSCPGTAFHLRDALRRWKLLTSLCLYGCAFLTLFMLATHFGYARGWGGSSYFSGLTVGSHTMGSVSCLIMALAYLVYKNGFAGKAAVFGIFLLFTYAILETGARTFLVPAAIVWILYVNDEDVISRKWLRITVIVILAIGASWFFASSSMAAKFDYIGGLASESENNSVSVLTSGRLDYWRVDLAGFFGSGPLNQLFGNSASFVHALNQQTFSMYIWSHNDFVMVLCAAGYVGLGVYIGALICFFKMVKLNSSRWQYWLFLIYVLFPAFINGFYGSQHLMYSAILLTCAIFAGNMATRQIKNESF